MAAPQRREALLISWRSPHNHVCSVLPIKDSGALEVDVQGEAVHIHGRNCYHKTGSHEKATKTALAELEITIPLAQCQINWHIVEKTKDEEIERSVHFRK